MDHVDDRGRLDLVDFEGGATVAGHGFYFLKNEAVLLELALIQYAVENCEPRVSPSTTPDLARDEVLQGTGASRRGPETQIYSIQDTDLSPRRRRPRSRSADCSRTRSSKPQTCR